MYNLHVLQRFVPHRPEGTKSSRNLLSTATIPVLLNGDFVLERVFRRSKLALERTDLTWA